MPLSVSPVSHQGITTYLVESLHHAQEADKGVHFNAAYPDLSEYEIEG